MTNAWASIEHSNSITFSYKEKTDGIITMEIQQEPVTVYGLDGNKQAESSGQTLQQVIKSLPKGVYIIRSGQQTKVIRH